jgi:hypothetical protein
MTVLRFSALTLAAAPATGCTSRRITATRKVDPPVPAWSGGYEQRH